MGQEDEFTAWEDVLDGEVKERDVEAGAGAHHDFIADWVDEPSADRCVDMLLALPQEEAAYYASKVNIVEWEGKGQTLLVMAAPPPQRA